MILPKVSSLSDELELWFVLEVKCNGTVQKSYIVQPSTSQFYRTTDLHERHHFQLRGESGVNWYIGELGMGGLKEIDSDNVKSESTGFFTVLGSDRNHFLPDLVVVNIFTDESLNLANSLRLRDIAELELINPQTSYESDERNNFRRDIGFTGQCYTDRTVIPGMNAPKFTTKYNKRPGLENGDSLTTTLMRSGVQLKRLVDLIERVHEQEWGDFKDENDGERHGLFTGRIAREYGLSDDDALDLVGEGLTFGATGTMPNRQYMILTRHLDTLNARADHFNAYWGFSQYIKMTYPGWGYPIMVRLALGCYGKYCVDTFLRRLLVNRTVMSKINCWMDNNPELLSIDPSVLTFQTNHPFKHIRPRANKTYYYSLFVHGCFEIGRMSNFDLGLLIEAVFLMSLCPSPAGWYEGVMYAACPETRKGRNLSDVFIEYMVRMHKCVSWGPHRRRQVSHGRRLDKDVAHQSFANMNDLRITASNSKSTVNIRKAWCRRSSSGGVHGAGPLIAQEQMTVLTMTGAITSDVHINDVVIGRNTVTADRLRNMGVQTDSHRAELLNYVSLEIEEELHVVENVICESGRSDANSIYTTTAKDTLVNGQHLYIFTGGVLRKIRGNSSEICSLPRWGFGRAEYMEDAVLWWDKGFNSSSVSGSYILTVNRGR